MERSRIWAIEEITKEAMTYGFELNQDQMKSLLTKHPQVLVEFRTYGNDTVSRECLRTALARTFTSHDDWPKILNGGPDYLRRWNAFCKDVLRAAMAGKCDIRTARFR